MDGAREMGIDLDTEQADRLAVHAEALMIWAEKTNLTAIREPVAVAVKHYLDSLAPAAHIPDNARLLDVGSGGGFPGIPLKILIPSLCVTLLDASRKKVSFLKHVIRILSLEGIDAVCGRAETLSTSIRFDVIVSRAVADLAAFVRIARPLLTPGGMLLTFKAAHAASETASFLEGCPQAGAPNAGPPAQFSVEVHSYRLPYRTPERSLILLRRLVAEGENGR